MILLEWTYEFKTFPEVIAKQSNLNDLLMRYKNNGNALNWTMTYFYEDKEYKLVVNCYAEPNREDIQEVKIAKRSSRRDSEVSI